MPTIKILVGDQLVDAEIVMHEGGLYAKVPDQLLSSSMPVLVAKLEVQLDAVSLLLQAGDLVRAAERSFPVLYRKEGGELRAKELARDYMMCKEEYESGKFDSAKKRLLGLKRRLKEEMVSLELSQMVKPERKKSKSKKVRKSKIVDSDGKSHDVYHMAARFDGARLNAKLYGADPKIRVGQLVDLSRVTSIPDIPEPMLLRPMGRGDCICTVDNPSQSNHVGWTQLSLCYDSYGKVVASSDDMSGSTTMFHLTTNCEVLDEATGSLRCEKIRNWYYTDPPS